MPEARAPSTKYFIAASAHIFESRSSRVAISFCSLLVLLFAESGLADVRNASGRLANFTAREIVNEGDSVQLQTKLMKRTLVRATTQTKGPWLIEFCGELTSSAHNIRIAAKIDNQLLNSYKFSRTTGGTTTRCARWLAHSVKPGDHVVRILWVSTGNAQVFDRILTIEYPR